MNRFALAPRIPGDLPIGEEASAVLLVVSIGVALGMLAMVVVLRRRIRPESSRVTFQEPPFGTAQAMSITIELASTTSASTSGPDDTARSASSESASSTLATTAGSLLVAEPNWSRAALRVEPCAGLPVARAISLQMKLRASTQSRTFATRTNEPQGEVERRTLVSIVVLVDGGSVADPGIRSDRASIRRALEALARLDPARVVSCDFSTVTAYGSTQTDRRFESDLVDL